jgi:hypothetical protein
MHPLIRFSYKTQREEAFEHYRQNGLVIFSDLTDPHLFSAVREELGLLIQRQTKRHIKQPDTNDHCNGFDANLIQLAREKDDIRRRLYEVAQQMPSLFRFSTQANFYNVVRELGVAFPMLRTSQVRMDLPQDDRFLIPPHQEVKSIRSPNMVFMITALVDIPANKGALRVSPGSFKLGPIAPSTSDGEKYQFIPAEKYEQFPLLQAEMKTGESIVLNMYTIHGSAQNHTNEPRWSLIVRYEDAFNMPFLDGDDSLDQKFNLKG